MKILIIKPSSFGDIVQANPTAVALKEAFPGSEITWLSFEVWKDVVSLFPDVDRVMAWDRSGGVAGFLSVIARVRAQKFDLVVDLQGLMRSALIARFSGAARTIGVPGMKEFSWLLVKEVSPERKSENAITRSLACVEHLTGRKTAPRFNITVTDEDRKIARLTLERAAAPRQGPVIGLVPFVRGGSKQWPVEHYRALAGRLREKYPAASVLVFGSKSDRGKIECPGVVDLAGVTPLRELAALLSSCDVVIGGDTGPMHLAAAMDVPAVVIFGGSDIRETAPVSPRAVTVSRNLPCSPCRGRPGCESFPCLTGITPEEILQKASGILEKSGAR